MRNHFGIEVNNDELHITFLGGLYIFCVTDVQVIDAMEVESSNGTYTYKLLFNNELIRIQIENHKLSGFTWFLSMLRSIKNTTVSL